MKRKIFILVFLGVLSSVAHGQLITDSKSKLKTEESDKSGFFSRLLRSKKISATQDQTSFRGKPVSPKYSAGSPFKTKQEVSPKYSSVTSRSDRYGVKSPRYSRPNPFGSKPYNIQPRYSSGNPFRGADYKVAPRYSSRSPFRGADYKVAPRYSSGNPFRGADYKVSPRYSSGNPFRGADYKVEPRYSGGNPFRGADYKVEPRYSSGSPFRGSDYRVVPRYTGTKKRKLNSEEKSELQYYQFLTLDYRGDHKFKYKKIGDQHPSVNYHQAMKYNSPNVRESLRKWNVFWTRLNGNKTRPKGVDDNIKKPKFDNNERVIWND